MDLNLQDKIAVVTGASKGIGLAVTRALVTEGVTVVAGARSAGTDLPALVTNGLVVFVPVDLSGPAGPIALIEAARQLGGVDILVSNAAVTYFTKVEDFTPKQFALMFAVQVEAPFQLARLVLPGMREHGSGWILNISSIAARHPTMPPGPFAGRGGTVYGMCKAAIERFSTGLAGELYPDNIAVNALSPTKVVPTPGTIYHHLTSEGAQNSEPTSVMAEAALMLCSAEPRTLTGRITYSQDLLAELNVATPAQSDWS